MALYMDRYTGHFILKTSWARLAASVLSRGGILEGEHDVDAAEHEHTVLDFDFPMSDGCQVAFAGGDPRASSAPPRVPSSQPPVAATM